MREKKEAGTKRKRELLRMYIKFIEVIMKSRIRKCKYKLCYILYLRIF